MMNVMEFQEQWRNQMNGILSDMFRPVTTLTDGMGHGAMGGSYPAPVVANLVDSPPSLHTLSLNPQNGYHPPYYHPQQWDYNRRCRYFVIDFVLNDITNMLRTYWFLK